MKIAELIVGHRVTLSLVVTSAVPKETKAKKAYLALELYDGLDKISGNFWDWSGKAIPEKNSILVVIGTVSEWMGTKQLNIVSLATDTASSLSDFMPASVYNIDQSYKCVMELLSSVENPLLKAIGIGLYEDLKKLWMVVPGARSIHHAFVGGTLVHCLDTARIARGIALNMIGANVDLCVVGALLHDIGKLHTYCLTGVVIDMTDEGMLFEHSFMGASLVQTFANNIADTNDTKSSWLISLLVHIILSHHGKQEYGASITPACIDALIVSHADGIDAACEQIREESRKAGGSKWTGRIWALDNKPQLTVQYVNSVLEK